MDATAILKIILTAALKMTPENADEAIKAIKHEAQAVYDGLMAADKNDQALSLKQFCVSYLGMSRDDFDK